MSNADYLLDSILEKLVKDVELGVHAIYRGDARQETMRLRTDEYRKAARAALAPLVGAATAGPSGPGQSTHTPIPHLALGAFGLAPDEAAALTKCIMAWLPVGPPSATQPGTRCLPAGKELVPSWGEREKAREGIKRLAAAAATARR